MISFHDWLKLQEVGSTTTSCVAGYARNIFAAPVTRMYPDEEKRRKKRRKFSEWMAEAYPAQTQANMPGTQTFPQNNNPSIKTPLKPQTVVSPSTVPNKTTPSINYAPSNYKGPNKTAYNGLYDKWFKTKDDDVANVLQLALGGNEQALTNAAKQFNINKP